MIRKVGPLIIVLVLLSDLGAQSLTDFNLERQSTTQKSMVILGSWATFNLVSSPVLYFNTSGTARYFHQMNGFWNGVNLLIAGGGYLTNRRNDVSDLTYSESLEQQFRTEKILLFNSALDLAYIMGGIYLMEKANGGDRLKGYGQSVILQGSFLLLFDTVFYLVHRSRGKQLIRALPRFSFAPSRLTISF